MMVESDLTDPQPVESQILQEFNHLSRKEPLGLARLDVALFDVDRGFGRVGVQAHSRQYQRASNRGACRKKVAFACGFDEEPVRLASPVATRAASRHGTLFSHPAK